MKPTPVLSPIETNLSNRSDQIQIPMGWGSKKRLRCVSKISSIPLRKLSLAINGSESDGDELEKDNFPPNFKDDFKWSRPELEIFGVTHFGWVFWSRKEDEIEPSLCLSPPPPLDNCADFYPKVCAILKVCAIPNVRDKIREALEKLMLWREFNACLVQFWAPATTLEEQGRTLLTTQYQPFAFGRAHMTGSLGRQQLCEYRVKMCGEYDFYADAKSGEEQLGVPGRVFLHQFPEYNPVKYYSTKEYPQRDLALRCKIWESWAVPVFEHSSHTCIGVLETVSLGTGPWCDKSFLNRVDNIFKEFGLQCHTCKILDINILSRQTTEKIKGEKGLTDAFQELQTVLRSVCEIHDLPLAMTRVPCSACNSLQRGLLWSKDGFFTGVEFCTGRDYSSLRRFFQISHVRKGLVAEGALSSLNMIYCSDITQLSVDEYPLVPCARRCKLSSWFTICLQSVYTGNDKYVLEFFLSARRKDDENILNRLSFILGTIAEKFKTFRLASGKKLGEQMSVEVIQFQNDQKVHTTRLIQATKYFSSPSSGPSYVQSSPSVDSPLYSVQLIRVSRNFSSLSSDPSSVQSSASVANTRTGFQNAEMVTIEAKYAYDTIIFNLSLPCRLEELQQEVAKRLKLDARTYTIHYEDYAYGKAELTLICSDEDLEDWVKASI